VYPFELGGDGVQLTNRSGIETQLFVIRYRGAPPQLASCASNVRPAMVIPGPKCPKKLDVFFRILMWVLFDVYAPGASGGGLLSSASSSLFHFAGSSMV
jgi:hypothetical protein